MAAASGDLASAVDAVVTVDLAALSLAQLQAAYVSVAPQTQRLTGFGAAVLAEVRSRTADRLPTEDGRERSVAGWAAEASGDSSSESGRMIRTATALQQGLPAVAAAVLSGELPYVRAEVLTRLVGKVGAAALTEAEPDLITTAKAMDPVQLAAYVRHLLATWVEPLVEDDEAGATGRRYLKTRRQEDGSLWGSFLLASGDSEAVLSALEPLARSTGLADERSAAQRRADALVEVCQQVLSHGDLPLAGGQRPQLTYVLPADWAARRRDETACPDCWRCPTHGVGTFADLVAAGVPREWRRDGRPVAGTPDDRIQVPATHACATAAWSGPQTRPRIEAMLCDARVSRVLLDPLGQVRSLEALGDSVTPAQRRALAARDLGCAVRGCTRTPGACDAHHLRSLSDDGPTELDNLVLLCRRHHVLWHLGKLRLVALHVPWLERRGAGPPGALSRAPAEEMRGTRLPQRE